MSERLTDAQLKKIANYKKSSARRAMARELIARRAADAQPAPDVAELLDLLNVVTPHVTCATMNVSVQSTTRPNISTFLADMNAALQALYDAGFVTPVEVGAASAEAAKLRPAPDVDAGVDAYVLKMQRGSE